MMRPLKGRKPAPPAPPGDRTRPLLGARIPLLSLLQTLAVADHLNVSHAARALGVGQSSVSARIRALEEELGVPLFERHARGVRLTEAGRHFVAQVAAGIDHLDQAVRTAGMVAKGGLGRLRVGIPALPPGSFVTTLLRQYRDRHPGIDLDLWEGTARDSVLRIRNHRLDIGFVAGAPDLPDCHTRRIWSERIFAALPSSHPSAGGEGVTWSGLAGDTFIVRRGGTGPQALDHILRRLAARSPDLSIVRFEVGHDTLLSMVAEGYGVAIVAGAASAVRVPGVTVLPILDEPQPLAFSAVWSPHNRGPALRALLDLAAEMGRAQGAGEPG